MTEPLCPLHERLERLDKLECEVGNDCVACSLNERAELLQLIAKCEPLPSTDSVIALSEVVEFWNTRKVNHVNQTRP